MPTAEVKLLLSTAPDRESAERIAENLVSEKLAACVQLLPGLSSFYHWEGKMERSEEILILAKTSRPSTCLERLRALHPYEVPEGLVFKVDSGLETYLDWVRASCG
jgi:periplasmic divalent cation tolerance protein